MSSSHNLSADFQPDSSNKSCVCLKHWFPPESFITPASSDTKASAIQGRNPCLHNASVLDPEEWTQLPFGNLRNGDSELKDFSWCHEQFDHKSETRDDSFFRDFLTTKSQSRTDIAVPQPHRINSDKIGSFTMEHVPKDIETPDDFDSSSKLISGECGQGERFSSIEYEDELMLPTLPLLNEDEDAVLSTRRKKRYLLSKKINPSMTENRFEAYYLRRFNDEYNYIESRRTDCKRQKHAFKDDTMSSSPRNDDLICTTETVDLNIRNNIEAFSSLQLDNVFESNRNLKSISSFNIQITKEEDIDSLTNPLLTPSNGDPRNFEKNVFPSSLQELKDASKDYCKQGISSMQEQKGESRFTLPCEVKKGFEDSQQDQKHVSMPQSQNKKPKSTHALCA